MIRFKALFAVPLLTMALPLGAAERATENFRHEHAQIQEHLRHLDTMAGSIETSSAEERRKTAIFITQFLKEHILEHAKWEEQHLYPAVDKRAGGEKNRFTSTMRYEHSIIGRSIADLTSLASQPEIPATEFSRKTDRLLGLISAHFEEEEVVLLPILDKSMTRAELERELGE